MKIRLEYEETNQLKIESISVIGDFNDFDSNKGKMSKQGNIWYVDCIVGSGRYLYKFLINGFIKLNDPTANLYLPDSNDEIYSVIIVNEENERLYNSEQYTVNIEHYNINSRIYQERIINSKKSFNPLIDEKVVHRFEFTHVTGLHSITAIWENSYGEIFDSAEGMLFTPEFQENKSIVMWFAIDLQNKRCHYPEGVWAMKLFVDGIFTLEDKFSIGRINTYSKTTRAYLA